MSNDSFMYKVDSFYFNHAFIDVPEDIDTHVHDCYELYYFISGNITYYIEGQAYKLNKNDIIITNSRELHRIVFSSKEPYERKYIHFKSEYVSAFQNEEYNLLSYLKKRKLGYFNKISAEDVISNGIDKYWHKIEVEAETLSSESNIIIKTLFIQMLIVLNKILSKNKDAFINNYVYDEKVTAILDYLNKNLDKRITLDSLGQTFYMNKYYLCHIFKLNTGFTVIEYIAYKRIMKAQELLSSDISILETSNMVGFDDYSNFYKTFKKITGVSPRKYKKERLSV